MPTTNSVVLRTSLERADSSVISKEYLVPPVCSPKNVTCPSFYRHNRRKKVSFANPVVRAREQLGEEERWILWYRREEFLEIKQRNKHCLKMLLSGRAREGNEYTLRGLEHSTRVGANRRKRNRDIGVVTVLEEQDYQRELGLRDPESIAEAYMMETEHCRHEAMEQGEYDRDDATGALDYDSDR